MTILQLPDEIVLKILTLTHFSLEYMIQLKEVCKTWRNILHHIKKGQKVNLLIAGKHGTQDDDMQLYHGEYDEKSNKKFHEQLSFNALSPLGYPSRSENKIPYIYGTLCPMVGSHRGLVCFHKAHDNVNDPIYVCNPFLQETVQLPHFDVHHFDVHKDAKNYFMVSGFGYLYSTNEYKIIRIYYEGYCAGQVQVYTLGDKNGWRNKAKTYNILSKSNGVLSDGALHWLDDMGLEIVAFDLADEEFHAIPSPNCFPIKHYNHHQLQKFEGYLSVVVWSYMIGTDIYSFKEDENRSGCKQWSKLFTISSTEFTPPFYRPFSLTKENKILMFEEMFEEKGGCYKENTVCYYDPKTATLEEFADDDPERFQDFQVIPYMKSDVSIIELEADLPIVYWDQHQLSTPLEAVTHTSEGEWSTYTRKKKKNNRY